MPNKPDTEVLFEFLESIQTNGFENTLKLFYGFYRAVVDSNEDPEERGRIQVRVEDFGQTTALNVWIPPLFDMAGKGKGMFFPPELGDHVRVYFHMGDPSQPHGYLGGWFGKDDKAPEFKYTNKRPEKRGILTRMGSGILFSDEAENQYVRLIWHEPAPGDPALSDASKTADGTQGKFSFVELTNDGSIQAMTHAGSGIIIDVTQKSVMVLHESGHSVTMTEEGIQITDKDGNLMSLEDGDLNVVVKGNLNFTGQAASFGTGGVSLGSPAPFSVPIGEPLLAWLGTHIHPTGVGPSGPPLVPPTPALLSKSVKLKP